MSPRGFTVSEGITVLQGNFLTSWFQMAGYPSWVAAWRGVTGLMEVGAPFLPSLACLS